MQVTVAGSFSIEHIVHVDILGGADSRDSDAVKSS